MSNEETKAAVSQDKDAVDTKAFRLMMALSNVDPELLERSEKAAVNGDKKKKKGQVLIFRSLGIAAAAVFCIGIAGVSLYNLGFWHMGGGSSRNDTANSTMEVYSLTSVPAAVSSEETAGAMTEEAPGMKTSEATEEKAMATMEINKLNETENAQSDLADATFDTSISYEAFVNDEKFGSHLTDVIPEDLKFAYGYYNWDDSITLVFEGSAIGDQGETEMTVDLTRSYSDELVTYMLDAGDATVDIVENLVYNGVVAILYDDGVVEIFRGRLVAEEIVSMLK